MLVMALSTSCSKDHDRISHPKLPTSFNADIIPNYDPENEIPATVTGKVGGFEYVDLGLSVMWATYNVGTYRPEGRGRDVQWGMLTTSFSYDWDSYGFYDPTAVYVEPVYYADGSIKEEGYYEGHCFKYGSFAGGSELDRNDDVAYIVMGGGWRMPTNNEFVELLNGCDWKLTKDFNNTRTAGCVGISKYNGNRIFFPMTHNLYGNYWSRNVCGEFDAHIFHFEVANVMTTKMERCLPGNVRGVIRY